MIVNTDALDLEIGRQIAEATAAGQLKKVRGKPLKVDEAWQQTPPGVRMSFQILKAAGVPPAEVELFRQRAKLREQLAEAPDLAARTRLQLQISELEQDIAMRLEVLRQQGRG